MDPRKLDNYFYWSNLIKKVDFAFQPIVNIHNGVCLGYEAVLRGWEKTGAASIFNLFDRAHEQGSLHLLEILLHDKAIKKFVSFEHAGKANLFLNIDNRVISGADYKMEIISTTAEQYNLRLSLVCFEVSEKHEIRNTGSLYDFCKMSKRHNIKIAVDDFGSGFSGLQLLYHVEPNFMKIDRFFISQLSADAKKKLFVSKVVSMAHTLGIQVIAEGVETEKEYFACKDVGCDYIQGFFIQKPATRAAALRAKYPAIEKLNKNDRRHKTPDHVILHNYSDYIPPVRLDPGASDKETLGRIFTNFRKEKEFTFFPVIDDNDHPKGIIREKDLKEYVYSNYGKDLLMNKALGIDLHRFITPSPIADSQTTMEKLLESFSMDYNSEGVILTDNGKYIGFLRAASFLRAMTEKNLAVARDQNPLTRLAGNNSVNQYLAKVYADQMCKAALIYFDFDNFKPFNDLYGFRQGDRAILMFSEILQANVARLHHDTFLGHIGGDDFFIGIQDGRNSQSFDTILKTIEIILDKFAADVQSLYTEQDRKRGGIVSRSRENVLQQFPLLTASAAILIMNPGERLVSLENIVHYMSHLKKKAKSKGAGQYVIEYTSQLDHHTMKRSLECEIIQLPLFMQCR